MLAVDLVLATKTIVGYKRNGERVLCMFGHVGVLGDNRWVMAVNLLV